MTRGLNLNDFIRYLMYDMILVCVVYSKRSGKKPPGLLVYNEAIKIFVWYSVNDP